MSTPYESPSTDPEVAGRLNNVPTNRLLALTGSILLSAPIWGSLLSAIAMTRVFAALGDADDDPAVLAVGISDALLYRGIGALIGLVGVVLVSIALFRKTNRQKWFFLAVMILSLFWCVLLFQLGIIVGLYLIIAFWLKRKEFKAEVLPM